MGEDRGGGDCFHPPLSPLPSREGKIREEDYGKSDAAISGALPGSESCRSGKVILSQCRRKRREAAKGKFIDASLYVD
jgi:hypothetical protein